jgi:hypothetical protein
MLERDIKDLPVGLPLSLSNYFKTFTTRKVELKDLSEVVVGWETVLERGHGSIEILIADHKTVGIDVMIKHRRNGLTTKT